MNGKAPPVRYSHRGCAFLFDSAHTDADLYGRSGCLHGQDVSGNGLAVDRDLRRSVLHAVLERHGISRSVWSYKQMDFGLSDSRMDGVREELLTLL